MPMTLRGSRGAGFDRETLNRLLLVIFPDLEVLGGQVGDVVALLVGDDRVHEDKACLRLKDWRGTVRGLRLSLRLLLLGLRLLRICRGHQGLPAHPSADSNKRC